MEWSPRPIILVFYDFNSLENDDDDGDVDGGDDDDDYYDDDNDDDDDVRGASVQIWTLFGQSC